MTELDKTQVKAWALARSIFGANQTMCEGSDIANCFSPQFPFNDSIHLSSNGGLLFSYSSLEKLVGQGFAFPKVKSFFISPILCFKSMVALLKIKGLYSQIHPSFNQVRAIFRASVEATLAFANHYSPAREILEGEKGRISFMIDGLGEILNVGKNQNGLWAVIESSADEKASVILSFQNLEYALLSALGKTNHMTDPVIGKFALHGRITLIEKFGFVSRLALNDLPTPKR